MTPTERLQRDYRVALLRYLTRREEAVRHVAYELGRGAISDALSVLDAAQIHHTVLLEVLAEAPASEEVVQIASAAFEFLVEFLTPFEMARRSFPDNPAKRPARQ